MSWLTDRDDAAAHPRRALAFMLVAGLIAGGAIGYFRFDRSVPSAVILGVVFAAILAYVGRTTLRDPAQNDGGSRRFEIRALAQLALPFLALLVAFLVGLASGSVSAFVGVFAVGVALGLVLRLTVWR
jgi:hypothetical protein